MISDEIHLGGLAGPGGVVTTQQLAAAGISPGCVARRQRAGQLVRAGRGLYVVAGLGDDRTEIALVQARYPDAVATGGTAAFLHGVDGLDRPTTTPTHAIARRLRRSVPGIAIRRTEVAVVRGLRALPPLPLLADLAGLVEPDLLEAAVECFLRRGEVTEAQLRQLAGLAAVLDLRGAGTPPTDSYLETLTVQRVLRPAGLVHHRQVSVHVNGSFVGRFDFELESGLLVEADGAATHATRAGVQRDNWHAMTVRLGGREVEHVTWDDVTRRPRQTARRLAERSAQVAARAGTAGGASPPEPRPSPPRVPA